MSEFDEKVVIELSDQDRRGNEGQSRAIGLPSEDSPEETIRRMRAFPERAKKLRELIRALREEGLD